MIKLINKLAYNLLVFIKYFRTKVFLGAEIFIVKYSLYIISRQPTWLSGVKSVDFAAPFLTPTVTLSEVFLRMLSMITSTLTFVPS